MEISRDSFPDFVRNAEILWNKGKDSVSQVMRTSGLVREMAIPQLTGNTREFSEVELEEYASRKGESAQASRARVQQGYTKIGYLYRIAKDIGISYELRTQGKYPELVSKLTNLGQIGAKRLDLDLAHRITFGTATTYVDQDGVTVDISVGDTLALFTTAHTLRASSTTFRNRLASNPQLSRGSVEAMEKMRVENSYNQFGQKMYMTADILWVTDDPNTINTAKELLRSTSNPTQANSSVTNVYESKYTLKILPRVATDKDGAPDTTKAKYWGLAASAYSTLMLGMHEEPHMKTPPADGKSNEEFSTDDWNLGVRGGWMIATVTAGWISFSSGDGTA